MPDTSSEKANVLLELLKNPTDDPQVQSLLQQLETEIREISRFSNEHVKLLCDIGEALAEKGKYHLANEYLTRAAECARENNFLVEQALVLGKMADVERQKGNYRLALTEALEGLSILDKKDNLAIRARILIVAGLIYSALGDNESATNSFHRAYQHYQNLNDFEGLALAANRLGTAAMMRNDFVEAESWLNKSMQASQKIDNLHMQAGALANLGEVKRLQGNWSEAVVHSQRSGEIFASLGHWRGVVIVENNLGHSYKIANQVPQACQHYEKALNLGADLDLTPEILDSLAGLIILLADNGKDEQAVRLASVVMSHPARLDETDQFLAPVLSKLGTIPHTAESASLSAKDLAGIGRNVIQRLSDTL